MTPAAPARTGIALGSNLGDRVALLRRAVSLLATVRSDEHFLVSGLFETDPVGCPPGSPDFLNVVVELRTHLAPLDLLSATQQIELQLGREPLAIRGVNAPRPVDLDILYFENEIFNSETLTLPHPRMRQRAFVLAPLSEIRPDLASDTVPLSGEGIRRLMGSEWLTADC